MHSAVQNGVRSWGFSSGVSSNLLPDGQKYVSVNFLSSQKKGLCELVAFNGLQKEKKTWVFCRFLPRKTLCGKLDPKPLGMSCANPVDEHVRIRQGSC